MPQDDRMLPVDVALEIVLAHAQPLSAEVVPLAAAHGRVLAEPLVADQDLPPFAAATMDGFAVIASDVSPWREIIGEQFAGTVEAIEVTPGTAARITTGAPLPAGADAVVPVEHTELRDDHVIIREDSVAPGENVRPVGADLRAGDVLVEARMPLGPAEIGLLASTGHGRVAVVRRPRVSVLSTGDELVEPDAEPGPGQIRDANRFSLAAAAASVGADVVWTGRAPDDEATLRALLVDRLHESDAMLTSGGVSMGERDLVKALLDELGTVYFRRVFMKPGKPLNFATAGDALVFGLPGNPVSALVGFEIFVKPAFGAMAGVPEPRPRRVAAVLDHDVEPGDRPEFQRAVLWSDAAGRLHTRNTGSQSSARLMSFVGANALIVIEPRATPYRAGEAVPVIPLGPISDRPSGR